MAKDIQASKQIIVFRAVVGDAVPDLDGDATLEMASGRFRIHAVFRASCPFKVVPLCLRRGQSAPLGRRACGQLVAVGGACPSISRTRARQVLGRGARPDERALDWPQSDAARQRLGPAFRRPVSRRSDELLQAVRVAHASTSMAWKQVARDQTQCGVLEAVFIKSGLHSAAAGRTMAARCKPVM